MIVWFHDLYVCLEEACTIRRVVDTAKGGLRQRKHPARYNVARYVRDDSKYAERKGRHDEISFGLQRALCWCCPFVRSDGWSICRARRSPQGGYVCLL